ncbi:MAG TPA: hypothetical protein VFE17_08625 [Candidatus Baltobacteraceae bacterium]|nr:hypothetical protein [Candidatus Baltobacteraceae bacterium]
MILMICAGDPAIVQIGHRQSKHNRETFGKPHHMFSRVLPVLGLSEHLFVLAKSAYRERETPLLGDAEDQLYVDPAELFETVASVCPKQYIGNIYICTHTGGPLNNAMPFVRSFEMQFRGVFAYTGGVFGCSIPVVTSIPSPADPCWIKVTDDDADALSKYAFMSDI